MAGLLLKLRTWWEIADRTQKSVTIFGGAFLVLLLFATFFFASKPKMTMAFGGLTPADQGMVTAEIQKLNIAVEFDASGNVLVPSDKVAEVRAKLAAAGKLPAAAHNGNEDLAKLNLMTSPSVEGERLKTIAEGELARSIEMIDGIASARVHLTRGERSPFATEKKSASASVFVSEKAGGSITSESARAIAMLVANAVVGLELSKVFVLDNAGRSLYIGSSESANSSRSSQKIEAERTESFRRERDLQAKLDAVIGRGNSIVTVNLEMDFDTETTTTNDKKPSKNPSSSSVAEETMQKGGSSTSSPTGAPSASGVGAQDPTAAGINATPGNGYLNKITKVENPITEVNSTSEKALGAIKKMSIAVMVNKDTIKDSSSVQQFLDSYIEGNPTFKATVTDMSFDKTAETEAKKIAGANSSREMMQQVMSLLPIVALLVVAFLVMKAIAKAAKSQTMLVHALPDGTLSASMPQLDSGHRGHDDRGGRTTVDDAVQALAHRTGEDVGDIETRMNKPLEQIKRMAHDRPESVAMLIKSWLLEERR